MLPQLGRGGKLLAANGLKALELEPGASDAQEMLDHVNAALTRK